MNERIKELAIQAKLHSPLLLQHWGEIDALTDSEQEELENIEKFAELIIKECVVACEKNSWLALNASQRSKQIKEHFGIEK